MHNVTHIDCNCGSPEHILRFIWDADEQTVYTEVQLRQWRNPVQRVWVAIKYVFGYQCRYGCWDCCIMGREAIENLHKWMSTLLQTNEKHI